MWIKRAQRLWIEYRWLESGGICVLWNHSYVYKDPANCWTWTWTIKDLVLEVRLYQVSDFRPRTWRHLWGNGTIFLHQSQASIRLIFPRSSMHGLCQCICWTLTAHHMSCGIAWSCRISTADTMHIYRMLIITSRHHENRSLHSLVLRVSPGGKTIVFVNLEGLVELETTSPWWAYC